MIENACEQQTKKSVRQAKNTVKTNTKLMSALVQRSIFRTQFYEKSHGFGDIDFGRFLEGFWKGFGKAQILDSHRFFDVISKQNLKCFSDSQRIAKSVSLGEGTGSEPPTALRARATGKSPPYLRAGPPVVNPMGPLGLQRIPRIGFLQTSRLDLKTKFCAQEWRKEGPSCPQTLPSGAQD